MTSAPPTRDVDEKDDEKDDETAGEAASEPVGDPNGETAGETDEAPMDSEDDESLGTQSELESLGPCKVRIKAEVSQEKVQELLNRNYKDLISTLQIPGFRRGKVPRRLVEKRYGAEIEKDLKEALLNDSFLEVIKDKDLKVVGSPKFEPVELKREEAFRYQVEVEVRPEFELTEYKGIEVERPAISVTDEEVETELATLRRRHASLSPIELHEAKPDDTIVASCRWLDGNQEVHRIDEVAFVPESGRVGELPAPDLARLFAERGDAAVIRFQARVPDDAPREDLRGKDVAVELQIEDAKRVVLPDLDDEFAKSLQCGSVEELKTTIREHLDTRHQRQAEFRMEDEILKKIEASIDFPVPEGMLEDQVRLHRLRLQHDMMQHGHTKEEIEEELKKRQTPAEDDIRREIRRYFLLEKIAEKERIFATEDDIRSRIHLLSQVYRVPVDQLVHELSESGRIEELRTEIRQGKVKRFLREKAKVSGNGAGEPKAAAAPSSGPSTTSAAEGST
jgi:trigger factor